MTRDAVTDGVEECFRPCALLVGEQPGAGGESLTDRQRDRLVLAWQADERIIDSFHTCPIPEATTSLKEPDQPVHNIHSEEPL